MQVDPVLQMFYQKAKEMEQAAGPAPCTKQQRQKPMTTLEAILQFKQNIDPLKYYGVCDFKKELSRSLNQTNSKTVNQSKIQIPLKITSVRGRNLPRIGTEQINAATKNFIETKGHSAATNNVAENV